MCTGCGRVAARIPLVVAVDLSLVEGSVKSEALYSGLATISAMAFAAGGRAASTREVAFATLAARSVTAAPADAGAGAAVS